MFIFKKIIACFLTPLSFTLLLSFLGLFLLWFTTKQKVGKILVSVGVILLTLFSCNFVADKLLRPLERQYNKLDINRLSAESKTENGSDIKFIVILAGGHISDPEIPLLSQINSNPLVRLIEGIRIYKNYPGAKLLLSGGGVLDPFYEAEVMAAVAREMGIPERDIILETKSRDTKDEAMFIKPIVGNEPFVLVTTASHIPRSMALFKKLGMDPIPSPVGHIVRDRQRPTGFSIFPRTGNLKKSDIAIYEYLGLTWAKLRGQI
ncbi:MAG: envelope biogenesis factor ElyC [Planctomycetota bacterium]